MKIIKVTNVLLRSSGMVDQAEIHIELSGDKPLSEIEMLSLAIEIAIRSKIPSLEKISIIPHSSSEMTVKPTTSEKLNYLRKIKWRQATFRANRNRQIKENNK